MNVRHDKARNVELKRCVGLVLATWRTTRRLTQAELAELAGVSVDSVFRAEHRGVESISTLERYATALGIQASAILGEAEERLRRKAERAAAIAKMRESAAEASSP